MTTKAPDGVLASRGVEDSRRFLRLFSVLTPRLDSMSRLFLQLTKDRFLIEWENTIVPDITSGKRVLIAAHGNTIRGLCQHLDDIPDDVITGLDIPTGERGTIRNWKV